MQARVEKNEINELRLALLLNDASIDQILAIDNSLHIIAWNKACEDITGIPRDKALGKTLIDIHPRVANYPAIMEGIVRGIQGYQSFVPWEKGGYAAGYFEHHFIPLDDGAGIIGVQVVIHNVAHRIKAEQKLQRLNDELAAKTAEIASFNWIASHDLKEPLRKIYTFIELVATNEGSRISDAARGNLRRAQSAAHRMSLLTDDIATFTQVAAPTEQAATADLNAVLGKAVAQHRRRIESECALIEADPLPSIQGYPEMLALLFHHLLANALKFQKEGAQPKLQITYEQLSGTVLTHKNAMADASYHCISFRDNGIGFAPEYAEKIFGMFQRLNPAEAFKGTGMGLAICRKVAEAHHGFITVESDEGAGATFRCYLQDLSDLAVG
jgi:PAS domain S-box-containing protein